MTLTLSAAEYRKLHQKKAPQNKQNSCLEDFETIYHKPNCLEQSGFTRHAELMPGIWLDVLNWHYEEEMILKVPVHPHQKSFAQLLLKSNEFKTSFFPKNQTIL